MYYFPFITYNLTLITRKPYTLLTNPTIHYCANNVPSGNYGVITNNPNTWIPYSSNTPKSIYDPCPYGYRIPKDGSWIGFPANSWTKYDITGGTSWSSSWWPAAGSRNTNSAILVSIGHTGHCWSSSSNLTTAHYAYYLTFNYSGGVNPSYTYSRSIGLSVRCIEGIRRNIKYKEEITA